MDTPRTRPVRPRVGISRCLLGERVRHDGGHKHAERLLESLDARVEWVPVCPEVEIGMGTPREPIQLVATPSEDGIAGRQRVRLVGVSSGEDWTLRMTAWAEACARMLAAGQIAGFVLKRGSPSCGIDGVKVVHAQTGGECTADGRGLFAQALIEAMPGLPVEDEASLLNPDIRDAFLSRVHAYQVQRPRGGP